MAADCSYFCSSITFTSVRMPYCSADGSGLLILPPVNGFHYGSRAVWLRGWHWIAHTSARQWLSRRFAHCIAQWMVADSSYFQLLTAFTTVSAPYCSADGSGLLKPPLFNGFPDCSSAASLSGWQPIAHSSARQWPSWFVRRFPQRVAAHRSFFLSSTSFMVCALFCSAAGNIMLILPLSDGFHNGLHAVLHSGWQRIAHTSTCQRLSRFARRISQWMAVDCSHLRLSTAFMPVCVPYCAADRIALRTPPLVNGFHGLRAVFVSGW